MRAPRPLQVPGQVRIGRCLQALFLHLVQPELVDTETIEGIGLKYTEGKNGSQATSKQASDYQCLDRRSNIPTFFPEADEENKGEEQCQRVGIQLGSQCHAIRQPKEDTQPEELVPRHLPQETPPGLVFPPGFSGTILCDHDLHGKQDRQCHESDGEIIGGEKMGLLDLHDSQGGESCRQEGSPTSIQTDDDQIEKEDGDKVGGG